MNPFTQQGITALKAGRKAEARHFLKEAIQQDPQDLLAWLWLSGAVDDDNDKNYCLRMVLRLDPNNEIALRGLGNPGQYHPQSQAQSPAPVPTWLANVASQTQGSDKLPHVMPFTVDWEKEPVDDRPQGQEPAITIPTRPDIPAKPAPALSPDPSKLAQKASQSVTPNAKKIPSPKSAYHPWVWIVMVGMLLILLLVVYLLLSRPF